MLCAISVQQFKPRATFKRLGQCRAGTARSFLLPLPSQAIVQPIAEFTFQIATGLRRRSGGSLSSRLFGSFKLDKPLRYRSKIAVDLPLLASQHIHVALWTLRLFDRLNDRRRHGASGAY
jgi:hypothetical protein